MRINTNIGALTAATYLTKVNDAIRTSSEKLSSGFRINKASDDAAGLGVANTFRSDIRALTQAQRNAEQAQAVFNIAEGGATAIAGILERMKELAAQSASDSVDSNGRSAINLEFGKLQSEIDRIANTTEFQGKSLLNGGFGSTLAAGGAFGAAGTAIASYTVSGGLGSYTFTAADTSALVTATYTDTAATPNVATQVLDVTTGTHFNFNLLGVQIDLQGAVNKAALATAGLTGGVTNKIVSAAAGGAAGTFLIGASRNHALAGYQNDDYNVLKIGATDLTLTGASLGVNLATLADVSSLSTAQTALKAIDDAIVLVNTSLGKIGAGSNRLTTAIDSVKTTVLNYQSAESTIRDLDMAAEMVKYSKNQILAQAGTAMLAQANQSGQGILKLLQ